MSRWFIAILLVTALSVAKATTLGSEVAPYVLVSAPNVALRHVNVIDGTGAMSRSDQTVVIFDGRVTAIGPSTTTPVPEGAEIHDCPGYSVLPGLVGMHDHLFYSASNALQRGSGPILEPGILVAEIAYTAPRLYLAAGVTTLRTTGSVEPYTDLKVRSRIESNLMPGPTMGLTAPYLEGGATQFAQMHEVARAEEARRFAGFWAESGMTSFKAYTHLTRAELAAGVTEAHRRGLKMTGHLCSVSWPEAVEAGIDNLEHGPIYTDSEFVAGKQPDACPKPQEQRSAWLAEAIDGTRVTVLIRLLVSHHVAVTSTLPVFEARVPGRPAPQRRMLDAMSTLARESYLTERANLDPTDTGIAALFRKEMDFERAFVAAGGLLLAGPDPTGNGGVLPGFGNQREIELLVEAGFNPVEAIHIATQNGARFLGRDKEIGTLESGKSADLVLVKGDPAVQIADIENVEIVFKRGVGYDSRRLIDSVRGQVGIR
ncbi:MAG TPA: amidohydrolase family protein [Steroidobacteraceae bacterium]|nr:amidohydrolase family protein [Steroidobacteraceae bacterium]